jgi:hypothetical protein
MRGKYMQYLFKGLAIFGGIVVAAIFIRSSKTSKTTGQTLTDAVKSELVATTSFNMFLLLMAGILGGLLMIHEIGQGAAAGLTMAYLWGSVAASVSGSFNITYVPQYIGFSISSAPTSFQINVQGDGVIFNLDAAGVTAMRNIRNVATQTNMYIFQLANGLINGKNGTVTITNAAASQLTIYGWSKEQGNFYMTYLTQQALAASGVNFKKFAYAAFPSAAAADLFTLTYNDGSSQVSQRDDLNFALQYTQNDVTSKYNIDNIAPASLDTVSFNPVAAQNVYIMKYQSASGVVDSAVNG